jgi:hypothetical protein
MDRIDFETDPVELLELFPQLRVSEERAVGDQGNRYPELLQRGDGSAEVPVEGRFSVGNEGKIVHAFSFGQMGEFFPDLSLHIFRTIENVSFYTHVYSPTQLAIDTCI